MGRPCGCGGTGLVVACGTGMACSGLGSGDDPLIISWEVPLGTAACNAVMDCVSTHLGQGMDYRRVARVLSLKLSSDANNTLGFGSDRGLLSSGTSDPGIGGVSVASLPGTNVLGGTYGAGYAQWPEAVRRTYETALLNEDLTMMHVPVRRSQERMLRAIHFRTLSIYGPISATERSNFLDTKQNNLVTVQPSGPLASGGVPDPRGGYFGQSYPPQRGFPGLEDVFRVSARRIVLYLETKDIGASMSDTPDPLTTLSEITALITKWSLQKSVIVGSQLPAAAAAADLAAIKQGLQDCKTAGVEIAAHILTATDAAANPPETLQPLGVTWVMISVDLPDATITVYKDAGLNVMLVPARKQHHWKRQQDLGLRGALCSDPVYCGAATYGYRYRHLNESAGTPHTWTWITQDYGRHAYDGSIQGAHAKFRGFTLPGQAGVLSFGPEAAAPANSGYHCLLGEFCPIPDLDESTWRIDFGVSTTDIVNQEGGLGMGLTFGVPVDENFFDLRASRPSSQGYTFVLATNGNFVYRRYDGVAGSWQYESSWASGFGRLTNNTTYGLVIIMSPGELRLGPVNNTGHPTFAQTFDASRGGGHLWRGPYIYATYNGRPAGYTGLNRFHTLRVTKLR